MPGGGAGRAAGTVMPPLRWEPSGHAPPPSRPRSRLSRLLGGSCEAAHTPHGKSVRPLRGQAICSLIYGLPERRLWRRKGRPEGGPSPQLYGCCLHFLPVQD